MVAVIGGNGDYDPIWPGFDETVGNKEGWMDPVSGTSRGAKYEIIDGLAHGFYESDDYGAAWGTVNLPASPKPGRVFTRVNTNGGGNVMRDYKWNDEASAWQSVEYT